MKTVLISIQPKWCELIASGKKTVEVRKTRPKIETPFKVYIYCTKEKTRLEHFHIPTTYENLILNKNIDSGCQVHFYNGIPKNELCIMLNGKVIGEFVCRTITAFKAMGEVQALYNETKQTCVSNDEIIKYANGKKLYYWHISDLVIYDKPRELSEFRLPCDHSNDCCTCKRAIYCSSTRQLCRCDLEDGLKRPPQSWCYVEEVQNERNTF